MRVVVLVSGIVLLALVVLAAAGTPSGRVEHGRYLVNSVAMCVQCHSPRDARGEIERDRLLQGAPIPVRSPFPNQQWAFAAPAIAGLPGWTNGEDVVTLLMTGHRPDGYAPMPPMPPFRLSREDAEDVVAYLRSLR